MRIRNKNDLLLTLATLLGIFHQVHAAHAQSDADVEADKVYRVEFSLYRIALSPTPGDIEYFENGRALVSGRIKIEELLENRVGVVLEDIHLKEIAEFLNKTYEVNIIVDKLVIRPKEPETPDPSSDKIDDEYATDGMIAYIDLKNVTLKEALKAIVRPLGLDYSIQSGYIWISTPEKIKSESFGLLYRPSSTFTYRQEGAYVLYDKETIVLGRPELKWSGKQEPAALGIARLASSKFMATEGQESEIRVGDSTPIQYFEPMEAKNGTAFLLRTLREPIGFVTSTLITSSESPREVDVKLSLTTNIVGKRATLDGVFLDVGEPSVSRTERTGTHRVTLGRWASLLGSTDNGNALLLLFKISSVPDPEDVSQNESDEVYVVEAKFIRYRGKFHKERLKSKLAGSRRVGLDVFRLKDGILPLRRRDVDFSNLEALSQDSKLRGVELISAPRVTILGMDSWSRSETTLKLVFPSGSPVVDEFSDLERGFRIITPEDYQLPISVEGMTGRGIIVDVDLDRIFYNETRQKDGFFIKSAQFYEANTGVLLAVGVDDLNGANPPMLDIYAQVRTKSGEDWGVAKSRDEAAAKVAAELSFFDIQDRVEFSDGAWLTYFTSLSEDEHYITLVSVKKKPSGN